jgi:hypothetical protein
MASQFDLARCALLQTRYGSSRQKAGGNQAQIAILGREAEHRAQNVLATVRRRSSSRKPTRPMVSNARSTDEFRRLRMPIGCLWNRAGREPSFAISSKSFRPIAGTERREPGSRAQRSCWYCPICSREFQSHFRGTRQALGARSRDLMQSRDRDGNFTKGNRLCAAPNTYDLRDLRLTCRRLRNMRVRIR